MTTTASEIAAYIGAAAWLYPIGLLLWHKIVIPKISFYPVKYASIGFTSFGPIFNIRLTIRTEHKAAAIESLKVVIKHEKGNTETFECLLVEEIYNEIVGKDGQTQTIGKNIPLTILMLRADSANDAFFKFQISKFNDEKVPYNTALIKADNRLKKDNTLYTFNSFLESEEVENYLKFMRSRFSWLPGKYSVEFKIGSEKQIKLCNSKHTFVLNQDDVDILQENQEKIKQDISYTWHVDNPNRSENLPLYPKWNWLNIRLKKE